jgi:hypothetical protein
MFLDEVFLSSSIPDPVADLPGRYAFYDDGWMGMLHIHRDDPGLQATYRSYRFRSSHSVTLLPRDPPSHTIRFAIEDFNELPRQLFSGYFFTGSRNAIAGSTEWKGTPFGFFARKTRPVSLGPIGSDRVEMSHFAGRYIVMCNGARADLSLDLRGRDGFTGILHAGREELGVAGRVDEKTSHKVVLTLGHRHGAAESLPTFTGFLFTRQKSAMAGWVEWRNVRLGCYMLRYG